MHLSQALPAKTDGTLKMKKARVAMKEVTKSHQNVENGKRAANQKSYQAFPSLPLCLTPLNFYKSHKLELSACKEKILTSMNSRSATATARTQARTSKVVTAAFIIE